MIKEAFGTGATLDEAKDAALKALGAPEDADVKYLWDRVWGAN